MSFLSKLFGGGKKSQDDYTGPKPYQSLTQARGGQETYDELLARMGGRNVGFRPEILSNVTSAYARQRRGDLESYEKPAIASAATARGLGRSSIGTSQIGRAEQEAGRDIESRVAQMGLADEEQRRQEINQALSSMQDFANQDLGAKNVASNFDMGLRNQHWAESKARKAEDKEFTQQMIGTGLGLFAASPLGMTMLPGIGAAAGAGAGSDWIKKLIGGDPRATASQVQQPVSNGASGYWDNIRDLGITSPTSRRSLRNRSPWEN